MADVAGFETVQFDYIPENEVESGGSGKSYAPPPDGKYWGQVPMITDEAFGTTREGYLSVTIDPITIVNANEGNGYEVRFTRLSGKKYSNKNTSQIIEFLRACGVAQTPQNAAEAKQYITACSGKTFQFALQWEGWDKDAQKAIKGMDAFPTLEDGTKQTWVPAEFDANTKVWANGKVRFFISAVK